MSHHTGYQHQGSNNQQRILEPTQHLPQLRQGCAGQDRRARFALVVVQFALQAQRHDATLCTDQHRGDFIRRKVPLQCLLRAEVTAHLNATTPPGVNSLKPLQRDQYHPVQGRPRCLQNPLYREGLLVMIDKTGTSSPMGDHNGITDRIIQPPRNLLAHYRPVNTAEGSSLTESQCLIVAILESLKKGARRRHDPEPLV